MKCAEIKCLECQMKTTYAHIIKTTACNDIPSTSIYELETEKITFAQFLQLMISPLLKRDEKEMLQTCFPEYVKRLEKGG